MRKVGRELIDDGEGKQDKEGGKVKETLSAAIAVGNWGSILFETFRVFVLNAP